jgi:hypothetical protein
MIGEDSTDVFDSEMSVVADVFKSSTNVHMMCAMSTNCVFKDNLLRTILENYLAIQIEHGAHKALYCHGFMEDAIESVPVKENVNVERDGTVIATASLHNVEDAATKKSRTGTSCDDADGIKKLKEEAFYRITWTDVTSDDVSVKIPTPDRPSKKFSEVKKIMQDNGLFVVVRGHTDVNNFHVLQQSCKSTANIKCAEETTGTRVLRGRKTSGCEVDASIDCLPKFAKQQVINDATGSVKELRIMVDLHDDSFGDSFLRVFTLSSRPHSVCNPCYGVLTLRNSPSPGSP